VRRLAGDSTDSPLFQTISGSRHPQANPANDAGPAPANTALNRMLLVLRGSFEQEAALTSLLASQHDPSSPLYHHWLTPAQFGERFGVSPDDINTLTAWLTAQGFQIDRVANSRLSIEFSGTAGQVGAAFHTTMRRYVVAGETHLANGTEISIPRSLTSVVAGIASLNDFHARPFFHRAGAANPLLNTTSGGHALTPGDFAVIYNVTPLYTSGIDGSGQTIAIAGRSNLSMSDVASFRAQFGFTGNNTQIVLNGPDPGIPSLNEQTEATLDVEWAGAIAKNATVEFILSASTSSTGGETLSAEYAVDNNVAPVLSTSFGICEQLMGDAGNRFYNSLWQQAAAQGISVIAAAGDNGAAGCDAPIGSSATQGFGVSGMASTPWNTAIGGTELNENGSPAYWSASNSPVYTSALSYIPEMVWNESAAGNLYAGSGGVSSVYAAPAWQTGPGVPAADPNSPGARHRYVPDVSLSASTHDPYVIVLNGSLMGVAGTSAAAPSFAGVMALVDQRLNAAQGNPAAALYALATAHPSAFNDVVTGTNAVPCKGGTPDCAAESSGASVLSGWSAGPNFDLASGLGSVNAWSLVMNWPSGAPAAAPVLSSLDPNPMIPSDAPQTLTLSGSGFLSGGGLEVVFTSGGASTAFTGSAVSFLSPTELQVPMITGTMPTTYSVHVVNPGGAASGDLSLAVNAPGPNRGAPVITSLNPNPMMKSNSYQALYINGAGFRSGAGLRVIVGYPGGSVTAQGSQVGYLSGSELELILNVGAFARTFTIQVVDPNGPASNTESLVIQ
jgi:hypothetical protein